jgi:TonB-dependent SusC/RagA subfamily outer membrane receptor
VQSVRAPQFERSPEVTFINALAGQTAGVQVTQSSGQPGSSARLVIRGEASFRGDGQPLYVIDGVPLSVDIDRNGVWCTPASSTLLSCLDGPDNPILRGEAGSRAMDIDPSNIEEISILRGAAATALYGSRAAQGAVVIRTKQGIPGMPLHFTIVSRFGQDEPILQGLQTTWGAGAGGFYCNGKPASAGGWCEPGSPVTDPLTNLSWGPHRDSVRAAVTQHEGALRFEDPRSDFYRTGSTSTQSIYGTGSMPLGTYGLGFSYAKQEGVFTRSKLDRLNLNANLNLNLSRFLKSRTTLFFANTSNDWGWEGQLGLTALVSVLPPTRDLRVSENPDGTPVMFGNNNPHPQWIAENEYATSNAARWVVAQTFSFALGRGLTLSNQASLDSYLDERREFLNERPWLTSVGIGNGGTRQQKTTRRTLNNDLVLTMDQRSLGAGPFTISGLLGSNVFSGKVSDVNGIGRNLGIPGYYNIGNFSLRALTGRLDAERRLVGLYSQATIDYKDWAFLTLTGRNDWSSTLPKNANSYFYPSASLAVVFTDALGFRSRLLDYGKLRLSVSKVGTDAPPYRLTSSYVSGAFQDFASGTTTFTNLGFPFRTVRGFVIDNNFGNPDIKPERTVETELGVETRLLNGHAR